MRHLRSRPYRARPARSRLDGGALLVLRLARRRRPLLRGRLGLRPALLLARIRGVPLRVRALVVPARLLLLRLFDRSLALPLLGSLAVTSPASRDSRCAARSRGARLPGRTRARPGARRGRAEDPGGTSSRGAGAYASSRSSSPRTASRVVSSGAARRARSRTSLALRR